MSVTVAVTEPRLATEVGETVRLVSVGALTVRVAVLVVPIEVAVMVAVALAATAVVVMVTEPVVAPAAMVTEAGTAAAALLLERAIVMPPAGAAEPIVTVAVDEVPPVTVAGLIATLTRAGGVTVSMADLVAPSKVAPIELVA